MLDCEILKTDYGVSYGSVTLKSLQNDNIPELDLLVREAIQNSSDAALKETGDSYSVSFTTGKFCPASLNDFMTNAKGILNTRYPDDQADFLEIRDTKTSGLTGCIKKSEIKKEDHGNFFKLIYDTGKRQTIVSAGGNWGFGKSVYYRVGIGIVIFYSRIKTNETYEDRLIITLIEDENKKSVDGGDTTILNPLEERSAGKAWWGIREGEDLLPITDTDLIQSILDVFGIKRFKHGETGTAVIIPYLDTQKLLDGIIPVGVIKDDVEKYFRYEFASNIESYLKLSIQRWYAPMIHNRELKKLGLDSKWLRVSVNNESIAKDDLYPFFRLVQELYTTALALANGKEYKSRDFPEIETSEVKINSHFKGGSKTGCVSMIRISKTEITGDSQNGLSPYDYMGKFEADGGLNEPVMMYARDPGMVIDYTITGPWVKGLIPPEDKDEYVFAFFVPETKKEIKEDFPVPEYAGMRLGEYLRWCEASDHMAWIDPVKMRIVKRIQINSVEAVNKRTKSDSSTVLEATASKLSNKLGKNLLPRIGYGKKKRGKEPGPGPGPGPGLQDLEFFVVLSAIKGNDVTAEFSLKLMYGRTECAISLMIASEAGWIDAASWKGEIGTEFPVQIIDCYIDSIEDSGSDALYKIGKRCDLNNHNLTVDELIINLMSETGDQKLTKLQVLSHIRNPKINGIIKLRAIDKKYQFNFLAE